MKTLWQKDPDNSKKPAGVSGSDSAKKAGVSVDRSWFYRFTTEEDRELDRELIPYDILVNIAQAKMLLKIGIYKKDGFEKVMKALAEAHRLWTEGAFDLGPDDEDVHSAVEKFLIKEAGPDGARIHTGRSRNDQVLADMRLYIKENICEIAEIWTAVATRLEGIANAQNGVLFAGLTHTQPAMPHSVDAWASGYLDALTTDLKALQQAFDVIDQSPLGSAAGYGVPHIRIDREFIAEELGFSRVQEPVAASQLSRGRFELQVIDALSYGALTFNRMASDIVLFMHPSWSLVRLSEDQVSGSSIMPQKRNPDAWELIRGAYHDFQSSRAHLAGVSANLTSGYHRDLQVVKKSVMAAVNQSKLLAMAVKNALNGVTFDEDAAGRTLTPEVFATHRANELVAGGMPFREAYIKTASEISEAQKSRKDAAGSTPRSGSITGRDTVAGSTDVYYHSGAPGSGIPDYLQQKRIASEKWTAEQKMKSHNITSRLLSQK